MGMPCIQVKTAFVELKLDACSVQIMFLTFKFTPINYLRADHISKSMIFFVTSKNCCIWYLSVFFYCYSKNNKNGKI